MLQWNNNYMLLIGEKIIVRRTTAIKVACVTSVSVWFRGKEIPRKGTFGFDRSRNETRAKKWKRGEAPSPLFYLSHFSRGLWLGLSRLRWAPFEHFLSLEHYFACWAPLSIFSHFGRHLSNISHFELISSNICLLKHFKAKTVCRSQRESCSRS